MLQLIEDGNLSKEEVIEHLINNGFLPVEVTEIGKLPISIGIREHSKSRVEPFRALTPHRKFREELTSERLRELSTTQKIPFDEMKNIDITDPDFDFERIDPKAIRIEIENDKSGKESSEKLEKTDEKITIMTTTEKNEVNTTTFLKVDNDEMEKIEAVMTMIRMFENGQIDEDELLIMMSEMGEGIIGDYNPGTEFTMFGDEVSMPVESSYFNMEMPVPTSQERPPLEGDPIVFEDDDLEAIPVPPAGGVFEATAGQSVGKKEPNNLINDPGLAGHSIKTFTSFGNNFETQTGLVAGRPQTLFYEDMSDHAVNIEFPDSFPTFDSFDLGYQYEEVSPVIQHGYLPPAPEVTGPEYVSPTPQLLYHPQPQYYTNINQSPLEFDELSHEAFAPGYGSPREPFGPPPSLLSSVSTPAEQQPPPQQPPSYVKSLPEYPAYGQFGHYGEGYPSYSEQPQLYSTFPSPEYRNQQHLPLPTPEYIPSELVHQSPLYLHHGPRGFQEQEQLQPVYPSQYYSSSGLGGLEEGWNEYSPRRPKGLPDHTTQKSFAYEDLPLPPLTGYREIDLTIEDIHKAFVEGDAMGPQGPSN